MCWHHLQPLLELEQRLCVFACWVLEPVVPPHPWRGTCHPAVCLVLMGTDTDAVHTAAVQRPQLQERQFK